MISLSNRDGRPGYIVEPPDNTEDHDHDHDENNEYYDHVDDHDHNYNDDNYYEFHRKSGICRKASFHDLCFLSISHQCVFLEFRPHDDGGRGDDYDNYNNHDDDYYEFHFSPMCL